MDLTTNCIESSSFVSEIKDLLEAAARKCFVTKVFLKISQNSQENTCANVSFLMKLQAWGQQLY